MVVKIDGDISDHSETRCYCHISRKLSSIGLKKKKFRAGVLLVVSDFTVTRNRIAHREKNGSSEKITKSIVRILFTERLAAIKSNSLKLSHWEIGINEKGILPVVAPAKTWDLEFIFEVTLKKKILYLHKHSIIILKKCDIEKGLSLNIFIRSK